MGFTPNLPGVGGPGSGTGGIIPTDPESRSDMGGVRTKTDSIQEPRGILGSEDGSAPVFENPAYWGKAPGGNAVAVVRVGDVIKAMIELATLGLFPPCLPCEMRRRRLNRFRRH